MSLSRRWRALRDRVSGDPFERALARAVARHEAVLFADGGRHVERFVPCGALDPDA